jgi:hypothetical protein
MQLTVKSAWRRRVSQPHIACLTYIVSRYLVLQYINVERQLRRCATGTRNREVYIDLIAETPD